MSFGDGGYRVGKAPKSARRRLVVGLVIVVVTALLVWYVGSYAALSRRGMAEQRDKHRGPYFFYVPIEEIGPSSPGLARHYWLRDLYAPVNQIDRAWLGGCTPCGGITWGFSDEPPRDP